MRKLNFVRFCMSVAVAIGWATLAHAQQLGAETALPQDAQQGQAAAEPGTAPAPQSGSVGTPQNQINQRPAAAQEGAYGQPPVDTERSILSGAAQQPTESRMLRGEQRGELGVWLVGTGGPGVEIRRITGGSAAEQAGLEQGDVILQVNGQWASSPQMIAELIRQIPIGQAATLNVWRNGEQQQLTATMQPVRETGYQDDYQVGFRGESAATTGDMASRTMRLEQQLSMVMQELRALRQEVAQLRTASAGPSTGLDGAIDRDAARPEFDQIDQNRPQDDPLGPAATAPAAEPAAEVEETETETSTETPAETETETDTESDSLFE